VAECAAALAPPLLAALRLAGAASHAAPACRE
jgi:hypothetical protein